MLSIGLKHLCGGQRGAQSESRKLMQRDVLLFRGAVYREVLVRADIKDHHDRLMARKLALLVMSISDTLLVDLQGWKQRVVDGVDVWVKGVSSALGTDIPVEIHISTFAYMEKIFGAWASLHNADAGTIVKDDVVLVVLPIVDRVAKRVRKLSQNDKQEFLHEFIHAIDYTRDFDKIKSEAPSRYSTQSPRELKAYFLSMADDVEQYIETAIVKEKQRPVYFASSTIDRIGIEKATFWFWKNQVGWTDIVSFKNLCYAEFINPRWMYGLSNASKGKVDKMLDDLWNHLEQQYGSPQNPNQTLEVVQ